METIVDFIRHLKHRVWLKRNGGHVVSYEESEQAYREGKIVNLSEFCPEVFGKN